ncbi:protein TSSC4-like [Penaeus chinensis]|uniref:protein TSSC4-like n=1 Tax=Penaeus chinensis TaxID=139456 RepID=UPI001FB664DA|nr:protein TSSC4-like [Penaeus chinensis]
MASFRLHSEDSEFNNRVDALFSSLATAATEHEPRVSKRPREEDDNDSGDSHRKDGEFKRPLGKNLNQRGNESSSSEGDIQSPCDGGSSKDGEFRRPNSRPPNWRGRGRGPLNSTPDYVKNPQKWTRYSMRGTKVLSDRENKAEGLRLFDKLRTRRMEGEAGEEEDDYQQKETEKIVFKKPVKVEDEGGMNEKEESDMSADALFGGPKKVKLPEYVVGQTKQRNKLKKRADNAEDSQKVSSSSEVKLGHLMFEEEDD